MQRRKRNSPLKGFFVFVIICVVIFVALWKAVSRLPLEALPSSFADKVAPLQVKAIALDQWFSSLFGDENKATVVRECAVGEVDPVSEIDDSDVVVSSPKPENAAVNVAKDGGLPAEEKPVVVVDRHTSVPQKWLSPCDLLLSKDKQTMYILCQTGWKLLDYDFKKMAVTRSTDLPGAPSGMVLSESGRVLYVTGGGSEGKVWKLVDGKLVDTFDVGHTPVSPVFSPDYQRLYVCNRFDNDVSFVNLRTGKTERRVAVEREPIAADVTPDGRFLFVANHIPYGRADVEFVASTVSVIDTTSGKVFSVKLVNGAEGLRDLKVSPDGKKVYVTHLMAHFLVPTSQLERGWISNNALSVIDVESKQLEYTVLLDDTESGFTNPWAIEFSGDGRTLVVSAAGNHELSLIDYPALQARIEDEASKMTKDVHLDTYNNLAFLTGIRKRVPLKGKGPRSLLVDGSRIFVGHYFSDSLEFVSVSDRLESKSREMKLGTPVRLSEARKGEIFFNDGSLCFQQWLSCATCHPDARMDAMNWDLLNDGIGNPKNAKSMLYAHKTPRTMWLGVRADAETGVRAGLKYIQFSVRPEEDAKAIDVYLKSLRPVSSPHLVNGALSQKALRGKKLFKRVGCVVCHPAPYYTDKKMYDMKTTKGADVGRPVDVPQLIEVWRTSPYLHDGSVVTIKDLLTTHKHGNAEKLSKSEIDCLSEFVLSL